MEENMSDLPTFFSGSHDYPRLIGRLAGGNLQCARTHNRKRSRSPIKWDDSPQAGFTTGTLWIKLHEEYPEVNVLKCLARDDSILRTYKALLRLRST